jgi:predicted Zn finger-like uncharacterized protein
VQANCPQCGQKIVIDDARVPDRAFSVKCPKCQNTVKFPGRVAGAPTGAVPAMPDPAGEPASEGAAPPVAAPPANEEMRAQLMAQLRREMAMPAADVGSSGRAVVALPDRSLAGNVTVMLTRQGFMVDTIDDQDEAGRLIEQGAYNLAVVSRTPPAQGKESLVQRLARLSPDNRRRVFVVLVGDEWKSGDGLQAFTACVDLVLGSREAAAADVLLRNTMLERQRLYQAYVDARHRHEAASV